MPLKMCLSKTRLSNIPFLGSVEAKLHIPVSIRIIAYMILHFQELYLCDGMIFNKFFIYFILVFVGCAL